MSEVSLKFWPEKSINEDKSKLIIDELCALHVIEKGAKYSAGSVYQAGKNIEKYVPGFTFASTKQDVVIKVWPVYSALESIEQQLPTLYVHNLIEIINIDYSLDDWEMMLQTLEQITKDDYKAGWELA